MPIIRSSRVLYRWLLPVVLGGLGLQVVGLVRSCRLCVRFAGCSASRKPDTQSFKVVCISLTIKVFGIIDSRGKHEDKSFLFLKTSCFKFSVCHPEVF